MTATVSVIIPAYRAAGTIRRAVDSILAQSVPVLEIIVVDDGSPDDVAAPLAGLDPRITIVRQDNGGASSARNRGLDLAKGEWIAFLDADDEWLPRRLEAQLEAAGTRPEVEFFAARFALRYPDVVGDHPRGHYTNKIHRVLRLDGEAAFDFATDCWTGTVLIRRTAIGEHRFRTDLRTAEDREFWFRMVMHHNVYALGEVLAIHHVTQDSLSSVDIDNDCANMRKVVDLHRDALGPRAARQWYVEAYRRQASVHLAGGRHRQARGPAFDRIRLQPLSLEGWWVALRSLRPDSAR